MVIYADVLFFINLVFDYMALILLGKVMKLRIKQWRVTLGSTVGAAGTVVVFCLDIKHIFPKAAIAFLMILCAYGRMGKKILSVFSAFLLMLAAISGVTAAIISVFSTGTDSIIKNGIVYFDISGKLLFVILLAAYPIICMLAKSIKSRRPGRFYLTTIELANRSVSLTALFDSGNILKEPITGKPVVVAEWSKVKALFDEPVDFDRLAEKMEEYRLWIIPYKALGKNNGKIFAFLADRIRIDEQITERVFVGITSGTLTGEYQALLNADLL